MSSSPSPRAAVLSMCAAAQVSAALTIVAAQQPTFRAGTDVVRIDVSVFDKNHEPVRGLTADDFTILENGKPQPIVMFQPIDLPTAAETNAVWQRAHGPDVQSNDADTQRIFVIVLDDAGLPFDPGLAGGVKRVAHDTVRALGSGDLAAVVFTGFGQNYNFTTNREELDRAIDTLVPRPDTPVCPARPPVCQIETLAHIGKVLMEAPIGRKIVVYLGLPPPRFIPGSADLFQAAATALRQANVVVYVFDPRGLRTPLGNAEYRRGAPPTIPFVRGLPSISDVTGGREVIGDNEPWKVIPDMMRDTGQYYLIGYQSTHPQLDGAYRRIEVKPKRRNVQAFTRDGYYPPKAPKADDRSTPASATAGLDAALVHGLPVQGVPLRLAVTAFAGTHQTPATIAVVAGVRAPSGFGTPLGPIALVATVFDDRWKAVDTFRRTVDLAGVSSWFDVLAKFSVAPGRYEVRVAAQGGDLTGSVFADIDVPDASKLPLSISGVTLARDPAPHTIGSDVLADLVPKAPTAERNFSPTDRVFAFVRISQGGNDPPAPVTLVARVVDNRDQAVWNTSTTLAGQAFATTRAAPNTLELPIDQLSAGAYLLTFSATMGSRTAQRHVIFSVVK